MDFFLLFFSYLIGSIPFGLIISKLFFGVDIRKYGSGNIGATNAWRVLGKKAGITVFVLDFLKGVLAVWLAIKVSSGEEIVAITGLLVMLGHTKSIFLRLKGGKGVATGLGSAMMMMPKAAIIVVIEWIILVRLTKYVSVGSLISTISLPILAYSFEYPKEYVIFSGLALVGIVVRHIENIKRLKEGKENKIGKEEN